MARLSPHPKQRRCNPVRSLLQSTRLDNRRNNITAPAVLPTYAWPGGYPILYQDRTHNVYCPSCATTILNNTIGQPDRHNNQVPITYGPYYEGPPLACTECQTIIESAYGDDTPQNTIPSDLPT